MTKEEEEEKTGLKRGWRGWGTGQISIRPTISLLDLKSKRWDGEGRKGLKTNPPSPPLHSFLDAIFFISLPLQDINSSSPSPILQNNNVISKQRRWGGVFSRPLHKHLLPPSLISSSPTTLSFQLWIHLKEGQSEREREKSEKNVISFQNDLSSLYIFIFHVLFLLSKW